MESSKVTPRPGYLKHQRAAEVWKQELQKPQPSSRQQHLSELIKLDCVRDLWCLHSIQSESGRKTMQLWHYQNCAMVTSERCCWELLLPGWMKMEEKHQKAAENNRCRRSLIPNKWYNSVITRNYAVPPSLQVLWNRGPYKYLPQGAALASPSCLFHPKQVIKIRVVVLLCWGLTLSRKSHGTGVHLSLVWENCEILVLLWKSTKSSCLLPILEEGNSESFKKE